MEKIKMFYMTGCPYCRQAFRAIDELVRNSPEFAEVQVECVEENQDPELAAKYNYYHVPSMFIGGDKLYEAEPGESYETCKAQVKRVFEASLR